MKYLSLILVSIFVLFTNVQARMMAPAKTKCFSLKNEFGETTINIKYYPTKVVMGDIAVQKADGSGDEEMGYNASEKPKNTLNITFSNPAPKFEKNMKWSKNTKFKISKNKKGEEILLVNILKYNSKTKKYYTVNRIFKTCEN